ncbi:MAG: BrnA antitoxin family protein [Deltaproteobacteria bacterium]|nr:BrnA antitoxin family protein [Deltaproteobacteria bacterium]MBI2500613.1 BrnA antitoxin family protein [Deltaproteobacteria bacterium]MBI4196726.1 BrnA antitoxin family protein [Deltaproteobacteria bacterium]
MKVKTKKMADSNLPVGKLTKVPDFLPRPEELVFPNKTVKVTIALDENSLAFFKKKADHLGAKYQQMIREVLRRYVEHYS